MERQISVIVFRRSGRKYFEAQWTDPETGRKKTKSTKKDNRRDAERYASGLEKILRSGLSADVDRQLYEKVVVRYRSEYLAGLGETTRLKAEATLNRIARDLNPRLISSLNEDKASKLTGILRAEGLAEATIKGHLAEIRKLLRWCFDLRLVERLPKLRIPRKTDKMKGRPITAEEFDRMIAAIPAALALPERPDAADVIDSWDFLLRGLWWSGLRLGEAVALHWTDRSQIGVDLSGRFPMFVIDSSRDKGRQDRVFPMAPEFAEMLRTIPKECRRGFVFNPIPLNPKYTDRLLTSWVGRIITSIGEVAGIKVAAPEGRFKRRAKPEKHIDKETKLPKPLVPMVKFASAHDLRRAFGVRWSQRVLPPVLQQMMRHESLTTTMNFYVGRNAEAAAHAIHEAHKQILPVADKIANTAPNSTKNPITLGGNRTPIIGSEVQRLTEARRPVPPNPEHR